MMACDIWLRRDYLIRHGRIPDEPQCGHDPRQCPPHDPPHRQPTPEAHMTGTHVYRYEVPVDDKWHAHNLSGAIVHVDCRKHDLVEFWALATGEQQVKRVFRVFGTGHEVPADATHVGTALNPTGPTPFALEYGRFVWHLFEAGEPS